MRVALGVLVCLPGCGRLFFTGESDADGRSADVDATPFSAPMPIPGMSMTAVADEDCAMTADRLELYFSSTRIGEGQIYRAVRPSTSDPWPAPVQVSALGTVPDWNVTPEPSPDGLSMWFVSNRQPDNGTDIFATTRASRAVEWGPPALDASLSLTNTFEYGPQTTSSGLIMAFSSDRGGNYDLYIATRAVTADTWGAPTLIAELATSVDETDPFLTEDGLAIYFTSMANGNRDLVVATRSSTTEPFGTPVPLSELNTPAQEQDIWLSPDGHHVIFASDRSGDYDLYEATR